MKQSILMKSKWRPRPHDVQLHALFNPANDAVTTESTILPVVGSDEGLGAPSAYNAHREHASFTEAPTHANYVGSEIHNIIVQLEMSLTSFFKDDNLMSLKFATMPIYTSFEDLTVIDELSTTEIQDVLKMQSEATDNQAYPLYNGTDLVPPTGTLNLMPAEQLGLTTDLKLEHVTFNVNAYYDAIHYLTISEKLKACQGGLRWHTLTQRFPSKTITYPLPSKAKQMQKKTFFGILVHVPSAANGDQNHYEGEMVATNQIRMRFKYRYNEWNEFFNFSKL